MKMSSKVFYVLRAECPACQHDSPDPCFIDEERVKAGPMTCWNCGEEFLVADDQVAAATAAVAGDDRELPAAARKMWS